MRARTWGGVAAALSFAFLACATGSTAVDDGSGGGGGGSGDGGKVYDANYNIVDGEFIPPDAAPHGGMEAGAKDGGKEGGGPTPIDSGTTPPPTSSDECPSGNTSLYNAEWYVSETPCTPGNGDCASGDCCFDRSLGSLDPYCITP